MTINDIKAIRAFLNLDDPCDAAIYACMVVVFYSVAQLGKFTVTAIIRFDTAKHVTCRNVSFLEDQRHLFAWKHPKNGLRPLSKTQFISRIIPIAKQCGLTDLKGHSL